MDTAVSKCTKCNKFLSTWDGHDLCPKCRPCAIQGASPCATCRNWEPALHSKVRSWLELHTDSARSESSSRHASRSGDHGGKTQETAVPAATKGSASKKGKVPVKRKASETREKSVSEPKRKKKKKKPRHRDSGESPDSNEESSSHLSGKGEESQAWLKRLVSVLESVLEAQGLMPPAQLAPGQTHRHKSPAPAALGRAPSGESPTLTPAQQTHGEDPDVSPQSRQSRTRERRSELSDILHIDSDSDSDFSYHRSFRAERQPLNLGDPSPHQNPPDLPEHPTPSETSGRDSETTEDWKLPPAEASKAAEILLRYWPDLRPPDTAPPAPKPQATGFRRLTGLAAKPAPDPAITLPDTFEADFRTIAQVKPEALKPVQGQLRRAFRIEGPAFNRCLQTPQPAEDLEKLGNSLFPRSNPLHNRQFKDRQGFYMWIDRAARAGMRLAAYQGALVELLTASEDLHVSDEDKLDIVRILGIISDYQWRQTSRIAIQMTRRRRTEALDALNLGKHAASPAFAKLPVEGPDLFAGKLNDLLDDELKASKRAAETAAQLQAPLTPAYRRTTAFRVPPRPPSADRSNRGLTFQLPQRAPSTFRGGARGRPAARPRYNPPGPYRPRGDRRASAPTAHTTNRGQTSRRAPATRGQPARRF